jgi:hypothetical protein
LAVFAALLAGVAVVLHLVRPQTFPIWVPAEPPIDEDEDVVADSGSGKRRRQKHKHASGADSAQEGAATSAEASSAVVEQASSAPTDDMFTSF